MPFQSQSSGGFFGGTALLDDGADDGVDEIEQLLALLGEAQRDLLEQALVDLLRVLAVALLEVEAVAPELVDVLLERAASSRSPRPPRPSSAAALGLDADRRAVVEHHVDDRRLHLLGDARVVLMSRILPVGLPSSSSFSGL